ncbi:MAG: hypothetical protein IKC33_01365 [Clostridia bacterium]|nr:hypothetical protein [Clostridia bacterium]MBQ4587443.1 hypothetical protein [Clostridia bacterium]MBQ6882747.1 hypothetical protein [Clostridia bacterium]MBR2932943.1 hypothetical protein [Clostridia bacterium]MBR6687467.1 hypothetical protein [Clostridia bacterium]
MKISQIAQILEGTFVTGEELSDREVYSACGSDMMSDVLAYVKDQGVLITGLCNPQVIRTAEMMDMLCIVFVRGKTPTPEMVELAKQRNIVLITSPRRMFSACGKLYSAGLQSGAF